MLVHRVGVAGERLAWGLADVGVPQPHRLVDTAGGDAGTGQQVGQPLTGHTGWVISVAFSPDGKRASHTRTVLSLLPEAIRFPSGLNATVCTVSVCPVSGWPTGWPVA